MTLLAISLSFVGGYFYGKAVPKTVYLSRNKVSQEVRDDYYHRCTDQGAVGLSDGRVEQIWSCPKMKLFLIKKFSNEVVEADPK